MVKGVSAREDPVEIPEFNMSGKRAVVVAGSRGIGRAIAVMLAEAGADVAVTGRSLETAGPVAEEIRKLGRQSLALAVDATDDGDMERMAAQVQQQFGPYDVVFHCVGESSRKPMIPMPDGAESITPGEWRMYLELNLTSMYTACRVLVPPMLEQRHGSVVFINTYVGLRAFPSWSVVYGAPKAAMLRMTQTLALEWAPYNVRANGIGAGIIPDPDQMTPERIREYTDRRKHEVPLRRLGVPRDVAYVGLYLASDASTYVTGQTLMVDGGATLVTMR
jgi:NAD(P)-dependent dehydrogenase (short-subunit alcohol dehydrogenase family)